MYHFDLPNKKAKLLEDSDKENIFVNSDPESDYGSDIELNARRREINDPSDDDVENIPTNPPIQSQNERMLELDTLFGNDDDTIASSIWVQPDIEDLCRSYVEDPGVTETQASISTCKTTQLSKGMPETALFENNNNCLNYSTTKNSLPVKYASDCCINKKEKGVALRIKE